MLSIRHNHDTLFVLVSRMSLLDLFSLSKHRNDPSRVIGIDVGSSSIKVVELQSKNDVVTLMTYGEVQLGPYVEKDLGQAVMLSAAQEQQALIDVIREAAVQARQGIFAIPLASSFVTVMRFKAGHDEDIASRIRVEARKYIPIPISDVALDWAEIALPKSETQKTEREILLAAIQNDELARLQTLMQKVNMPKQPSEIECFSTLRSLSGGADADDGLVVIDFGASSSKMYLARHGLLHRMHRVRSGGTTVTERLAKARDISFAQAESLKRETTRGDAAYADVMRAYQSAYERSLHEFRQVIDEFEERHGDELMPVVITGGSVGFTGFKSMIDESLGRETKYANPFRKVAYPAFMEDFITAIGPSFSVSLGAALRHFE